MSEKMPGPGDRSISIGGNVGGQSVLVTADRKVVTSRPRKETAAPADMADVKAGLAELRKLLETLASPDQKKINNAVEEAEDELNKPEPDRDEVGKALDRALEYSKKAEKFKTIIDKLKPHVLTVSGWLGTNWPNITPLLGG